MLCSVCCHTLTSAFFLVFEMHVFICIMYKKYEKGDYYTEKSLLHLTKVLFTWLGTVRSDYYFFDLMILHKAADCYFSDQSFSDFVLAVNFFFFQNLLFLIILYVAVQSLKSGQEI